MSWKKIEKQILKTHNRLNFLDIFLVYITDKTDHQILHLSILHTIYCCYGNCKPKNLMFKLLPKSKYPTGMLYFLSEHTYHLLEKYTSYLLEKLFEKDLVQFVSDSIFKRLKFDYSSSETASNQKIKIKNYFFDDCVFLEIRLTLGNQLLPNITRIK